MLTLWTLRVLGAGGFGVLGWRLGALVSELVTGQQQYLPWGLGLTVTGVALGALATPVLVVPPCVKPPNSCVPYPDPP